MRKIRRGRVFEYVKVHKIRRRFKRPCERLQEGRQNQIICGGWGDQWSRSRSPTEERGLQGEPGTHRQHYSQIALLGMRVTHRFLKNKQNGRRRHVPELFEDALAMADLVIGKNQLGLQVIDHLPAARVENPVLNLIFREVKSIEQICDDFFGELARNVPDVFRKYDSQLPVPLPESDGIDE